MENNFPMKVSFSQVKRNIGKKKLLKDDKMAFQERILEVTNNS